jgi:hypothetical protein
MHQPCRPAPPGRLRPDGAGPSLMNPALAARVRQLAAQAEHRRAIAEFRARRAADQQARINALILEAIDALASLLSTPVTPATARPDPSPRRARPGGRARQPARSQPRQAGPAQHVTTKTCRNVNIESCRLMCKQRGR